MSEWQPIETAPKDGKVADGFNRFARRILVWDGKVQIARWWWRTDSMASNFIEEGGRAVYPTHWMDIPGSPEV